MNIWKNTVTLSTIFLAVILWISERIFGGTKKSVLYPPDAGPVVKIYGNLLNKGRKALGRSLENQDPGLYQKIKGLFS